MSLSVEDGEITLWYASKDGQIDFMTFRWSTKGVFARSRNATPEVCEAELTQDISLLKLWPTNSLLGDCEVMNHFLLPEMVVADSLMRCSSGMLPIDTTINVWH